MNPIHLNASPSIGLHLFQELSTLGQQLANTLLFRQDRGGVSPCFQRARRDRSSPSVGLGSARAELYARDGAWVLVLGAHRVSSV